jgi:hypothetical protein
MITVTRRQSRTLPQVMLLNCRFENIETAERYMPAGSTPSQLGVKSCNANKIRRITDAAGHSYALQT